MRCQPYWLGDRQLHNVKAWKMAKECTTKGTKRGQNDFACFFTGYKRRRSESRPCFPHQRTILKSYSFQAVQLLGHSMKWKGWLGELGTSHYLGPVGAGSKVSRHRKYFEVRQHSLYSLVHESRQGFLSHVGGKKNKNKNSLSQT